MMPLLPRQISSLPLLLVLATIALSCNRSSNNSVVSAFAPSITPRQPLLSCTNNKKHALPVIDNGNSINSPAALSSIRNPDTKLYNLFTDAVGGLLNGPTLEAETDLPYDPPFAEDVSIADHTRTFAIKERPLSFTGEDFDIVEITNGNEEDFVRVRGAMLHLPGNDKMRVSSCTTGTKHVIMDRVMIAATPSYNLIRKSDGVKIGWIEKKLISFMDTFDVYMEGKGGFGVTGLFKPDPAYRIEGDFLDRNFSFKNEAGKIVAKANMDGWIQLDMMNHYQVQVAEGMDALLVLACVCCIDEEFDEEHQKRREERQNE